MSSTALRNALPVTGRPAVLDWSDPRAKQELDP